MLGDRTLTLYGIIFAFIATGAILFFWTMGAILLLTGNGGQINFIALTGGLRTLFLSYPAVALVFSALGLLLYLGGRNTVAVAMAGFPAAASLLFYLWLVALR